MADTKGRESEKEQKGSVTIRHYCHPEDLAPIRRIFVEATLQGRGSPALEGFAHYAPHARVVFFAAVLGIALLVGSSSQSIDSLTWTTPISVYRLGVILCSASFLGWIYVYYHRQKIQRFFGLFLDQGLKGDLGDVVKSFELKITEGGTCVPTGPSGFWIADEAGEVIGMVGMTLSASTRSSDFKYKRESLLCSVNDSSDSLVGYVGRLAVAPNHQGKRVAEKLMDAVVSHARVYKLQALELQTSDYNKSALRFYTRMGWRFDRRKPWLGMFSLAVMRQELEVVG
ncbi:acyl-CoA N-acyltransferase [Lyophyllum atratum]|nr:acyl-CoA N-acyltransferase [Lyophyllum atratum]